MNAYATTLNTGTFNGRCYRHVRVSKPHTKSQVWWVLDDGNYFRSLDALVGFVSVQQSRAACEEGEAVTCPDQHLCRNGIDN